MICFSIKTIVISPVQFSDSMKFKFHECACHLFRREYPGFPCEDPSSPLLVWVRTEICPDLGDPQRVFTLSPLIESKVRHALLITLSLLRVINVKFLLQPHQKYYITQ